MAITVKHKFVSAIPDGADTSIVRPSNWNDTHDLTGLGTMAEQNASSVAITGGSINNVAIGGSGAGDGSFDVLSSNAGNLNGTIGATTPNTGAFTYISTNSTTSTTPVLSFNASNSNIASGATVANSYLQNILQNKSGTAGASTNYVLSNDLGTDSSYYGEFGMNSSVFNASPSDFFSLNNGVYFSSHDGDVTIGSGNGFKTYLAWGTAGQSAHVINANGALGLNTNITGTTNFGTSGQLLQSAGNAATPTWSSSLSGLTIETTRINPRVTNITSSATITPPADTADQYSVTALAVPATIAIPSGTPVTGQKLTLRIKDNGTARALTWTTSAGGYRVVGATLPTTTIVNKVVYVGCIYNATESFWDVVAVAQQV
jgi:hypothetical protein